MAAPTVIAARLVAASASMPVQQHAFLGKACDLYKRSAQTAIGTYRFGWKQLASSTQTQRARLGYAPNEPLLRTGSLRNSIEYRVQGPTEADVGTNHPVAVFQEGGTSRGIPPRPFMGGALNEAEPQVLRAIEAMLAQVFR